MTIPNLSYLFVITFFCAVRLLALEIDFEKLTILTKPTDGLYVAWEHNAVMRSLKEGLAYLDVPFNYNPHSIGDISDVVLVPCNHNALIQAINLKKQGRIKKLFVGPNFYPHEVNYPQVDAYLVPSSWVIQFANDDCPSLVPRCKVWYAGIDKDFWKLANDDYKYSQNVLVYWKTENIEFCNAIEKLLRDYGWNPVRIKYGSYTIEQYKNILKNCRFAVVISRSESQGLALAECWAMDVPTFPWNPKSATILGCQCDYVSSCPYLNDQLGKDWKTLSELEAILQSIDIYLSSYTPREWVMTHMTDEASVEKLIGLINDEFKL